MLVSPDAPRRITEGACDLVLIRLSRTEQGKHRIRFGCTIADVLLGHDHSSYEHHPARSLGPNADAVVNDNYAGGRRTKFEEYLLFV